MCSIVGLAHSLFYCKLTKDDSLVEEKLKAFALEFPTRGFDWYYGKIRTEGLKWNRILNLVKRREFKKRVNKTYADCLLYPIAPNIT